MVVRICVRNEFSGTDAPSDVNRLPQSSSTAGPGKSGGEAAAAFGARAGDKAIRNRQAAISADDLRLVLMTSSSVATVGPVAVKCLRGLVQPGYRLLLG